MAREDQHFRLRIPEALKRQVEEAAALNKRSMTAEIVDRLEASFAFNIPPETRLWLDGEGEPYDRSAGEELLHRLELTRRFDLDVGESERIRTGAGPVADYIDEQLSSLRGDIGSLRHLLLDVLEGRNETTLRQVDFENQPDNAVRRAMRNAIEVTDNPPSEDGSE
jgi:hypothetical protein